MYASFARRELAVNLLEIRADSPPSAIAMIQRFHRLGRMDHLHAQLELWEIWFADIAESHTSLAALAFFRSPQRDHSWVNAAGAIMDGAALYRSVVDVPKDIQADLTIRAGYLALRRIADFFRIPYERDPGPDTPCSISEEDFGIACDELAASGVPLRADRAQAWRDFRGWRINYDQTLLILARLTSAPPARWNGRPWEVIEPVNADAHPLAARPATAGAVGLRAPARCGRRPGRSATTRAARVSGAHGVRDPGQDLLADRRRERGEVGRRRRAGVQGRRRGPAGPRAARPCRGSPTTRSPSPARSRRGPPAP